ncbi:hypothetical protein K492DRAFT_216974 [Lichtheimia hyalospora FSU 10163]|nr:hypothetical protein K492DRAFT_216974 [Lichtheimia hyalospora FSU 10163]
MLTCNEHDCKSTFESDKSYRNHVNNYHQLKYDISFQGNKDPSSSNVDDEICDIEHIPLPRCPSYDESLPPPSNPTRRHLFSEAMIHTCQSMEASDEEQCKNEWIIAKMQLEPIALIEDNDSTQKAEFNAITHPSNIKRMAGKRFICEPIMPPKRKIHKSDHAGIATTPLAHLLYSSPLRPILMQRQYFELDDRICQMLNMDWEHGPQIKYACAQVLAGCILISEKSGHAILVNTVEVYCRQRSIDIHREMSNRDGSIPSPSSYYENVWPCVLNTSDGEKLAIGTQTMNALVTSTMRLDVKEEPKVGPTTCTANLKSQAIPMTKHP